MSVVRQAASEQSFESHADFYRNSAYANFPQEHRSGGSFGMSMIKVDQDPIDLIDSPVNEIVIYRCDSAVQDVLLDIGDGPVEQSVTRDDFSITPAMTNPRTRALAPHKITMLTIPVINLCPSLERAGITGDATVFGRFLGRFGRSPSAARLMDRMWRLHASPDAFNDLLFDGLTLQFLSIMTGSAALSPIGTDHIEDGRIARAVDYIEAHIGNPLTVTGLASVAGLSPSQFARVFKATTGEPVWAFVQRRRIERARDMLCHTAVPISQIAYDCGFSSQAHMTTCVKDAVGVTPGALRAG